MTSLMASPQNQLISSYEESFTYAVELVRMVGLPMTLRAAIELDVFEIIAKAGPGAHLSPREISALLPKQHPRTPGMLDRTLIMLASYNVLTCSVGTDSDGKVERKYGAAPVAKFFTKDADGASLAPMALMHTSKFNMERWYHMKDSIMDGEIPFNKAHGMSAYEFFGKNPEISKNFNEAMTNNSTIIVKGILETYKGFNSVHSLVDVGGGLGRTLEMIVKKHPHIKAINFDLPYVITKAPTIPGVEHIAGDMFKSVPHGGDAILLKWILHNWGEEECMNILKNCWMALGDNGKVIIIEQCVSVYPEHTGEARVSFHLDVRMMMAQSGKERTMKEYESMAKKVGFSRVEATCRYSHYWVLEFYK